VFDLVVLIIIVIDQAGSVPEHRATFAPGGAQVERRFARPATGGAVSGSFQ